MILTQLIGHGEVELVPTWSLHPYGLVFMTLKGTLHPTKGEGLVLSYTHNQLLVSFILKTQLELIIYARNRISDQLKNLSMTL